MAEVLNCNLEESEFRLQLRFYIHFWTNALGKDMDVLIPPSDGLNSNTAVPPQGWLWHWLTHKGWYAIKKKKPNQTKSDH